KVFSDGHTLVTGVLKVTLTNTTTAKSIDLNISGPGTFTPLPGGESVSKSVGPWLFFFPANQLGPGSPPMLIRTTGQVTLLNHADGTQTFIQKGGTSTDMCPLLA